VPIALPLRVQKEARRPNTVTVKDANGLYVGLIHRRYGLWGNYPDSATTSVPLGPFGSMESAFEAFRVAVGEAN